ncbi:MAG TPA: polyprenyl synthetase family protein [Fimbriimonadaceae bacterium]|nr:polyprenyl synthetase family protein [Fimbriimonadaceae bacterium]
MQGELGQKSHRAVSDAALDRLLPPETQLPSELHAAMRYACLSPGKRLRPAFVLGSCEAVGCDVSRAHDAAAAVEMVHCFSLIHDDLPALDDDDLRRGIPTVHKAFGEAVAILAGDALFALAFETVARYEPATLARDLVLELTRATGSEGLVAGEALDILVEGRPVDLDTVRWIHERKTGALIAASCAMGGLIGNASPPTVDALRSFGMAIGLAFQVQDDILNETSTPEQLGKAAGSDRARGKATYPGLFGLERARDFATELHQRALAILDEIGHCASLRGLARESVVRSA